MPISMSAVSKRKRYLLENRDFSTDVPFPRNRKITHNIAESYITNNCSRDKLKRDNGRDILEIFSLLCKDCKINSYTYRIANYVNNEVLPMVENFNSINSILINDSYVPKDIKESFINTINECTLCDRIIHNDDKLSKRFSFDKIIYENYHKGSSYIINELCELIDTYNIPVKAKYNVALENINYSFYKNNIDESQTNIVNQITDYFLTREAVIPDIQYMELKNVLSTNKFIDSDHAEDVGFDDVKNHKYYIDKVRDLIEKQNNDRVKDKLESLLSVSTENDAYGYMKDVYNLINIDNTLQDEDKKILLSSIDFIPLISQVRKEWVDLKVKEFDYILSSGKNSLLESSMLLNDLLKDDSDIFGDYYIEKKKDFYNNVLESKDLADSNDIKNLLIKFKADQEKSPNRFKNLRNKIFTNSPESIINEVPSILSLTRRIFVFGLMSFGPIGVISSVIISIVNKLISDSINFKQSEKLLKALNEEKDYVNGKIDSIDDEEELKKTKEYLKCLDKCIEKVQNYKDSIKDSEDDNSNDFEDIDFDFEESCNLILSLTESGIRIPDVNKKALINNIYDMVKESTSDYSLLEGLSLIVANAPSIISINEYSTILESIKEQSTNILDITNINSILDNMYTYKLKSNEINESIIELEACNILTEGVNINSIKLAMQAFKKKIQNLSTKEKSMWQAVDVHASNLANSIQKALTSDRREAIIKGSIIPSFSKCIKSLITVSTVGAVTGPYGAIITALGMFASSKYLNNRERKLIYDEIDTELKVVEKQLDIAQNDGDMNQYRFLLTYQKKLLRERQRIKYGMAMKGHPIPNVTRKDD